jgi:phytanoyl-CoA hydroxylase
VIDLEFYYEYGYYIEENIFSDAECNNLIEASKTLPNYLEGTYRPMMMPHRINENYMQALRHPALVLSMTQLVGGKPAGLQTELFYCKPGTRGFSLHQDNFFVEAPAGAFASAWCALTDITPEKGGLIVYPGTHKEGLLPRKTLNLPSDSGQDPNANNEETIVPPGYKPINPHVPKGAALYIHGYLVHGSLQNMTDDWRYVLLNTYIREDEPFRPGRYAQREAVEL